MYMKRLLPLLLLLVLPAAFVGCSSETTDYGDVPIRKVTGSFDDEGFDIVLRGDGEWDDFIVNVFDKVDEGCLASFQCISTTYEYAKAIGKRPLTLKTGDRREAEKWASERGKEGYVVVISYDKENKIYKCQALKK